MVVHVFLIAASMLNALHSTPPTQDRQPPVKVLLESSRLSAGAGDGVEIQVSLADPENRPIGASEPTSVTIRAFLPSGEAEPVEIAVPFRAGERSRTIRLQAEEAGFVRLLASGPGLLDAEEFLLLKRLPEGESIPALPRDQILRVMERGQLRPDARPSPESPPAAAAETPEVSGAMRRDLAMMARTDGFEELTRADTEVATSAAPEVPDARLELHVGQTNRLADGLDYAKVSAFLLGTEGLSTDLSIHLVSSESLSPETLVIPRGEVTATGRLTSLHAGEVEVRFVGSVPTLELNGPGEFVVPFAQPIVGLKIEASPSELSLADAPTRIVVSLVNSSGTVIPTLRSRSVQLIQSGPGLIDPVSAVIAADRASHTFEFFPTRWGTTTVRAESPYLDLHGAPATIRVTVPWLFLLLSAAGGISGGLVAWLVDRRLRLPVRLLIGLVAGFLLCWAAVFGVIQLESLPRRLALNPVSVAALAFLGGWAGTEVFRRILTQFGLAEKLGPA